MIAPGAGQWGVEPLVFILLTAWPWSQLLRLKFSKVGSDLGVGLSIFGCPDGDPKVTQVGYLKNRDIPNQWLYLTILALSRSVP